MSGSVRKRTAPSPHIYPPPPPTQPVYFSFWGWQCWHCCVWSTNTNGNDLIEANRKGLWQSVSWLDDHWNRKKRRQRGRQSVVIFRLYKSCSGEEDLFSITSGSNEKRMRERVYQSRSTPSVYIGPAHQWKSLLISSLAAGWSRWQWTITRFNSGRMMDETISIVSRTEGANPDTHTQIYIERRERENK